MNTILQNIKKLFEFFFKAEGERKTYIETVKFVAYKSLLIFLICVALPIVLFNTYFTIIFSLLDAISVNTDLGDPMIIQFTGMSAWLADVMRVDEALSVVIAAVTQRFVFKLLRIF